MSRWLLAVTTLFTVNSPSAILRGVAKNLHGETVYTERHKVQFDEQGLTKSISVEYFDPKEKLIAKMLSDFTQNKMLPETVFEDLRTSEFLSLKLNSNKVVFSKSSPSSKAKTVEFEVTENLVASQGFNNFLRLPKNQETLKSTPIYTKFGVLEKLDLFSIKISQISKPESNEIEFKIEPKLGILRIFVNPIRIFYDKKSFQLKRFIGTSNLVNRIGQSQDVDISYTWSEQ